jgi:hypothetical protein
MPSPDDNRRAYLRDGKEVVGEVLRKMNAAMRVGITGQIADMQSDALPGQPLHVGHWLKSSLVLPGSSAIARETEMG